MSLESSLPFVGKEREHYLSLEKLGNFSVGVQPSSPDMVRGVAAMVHDWTEMLGSGSSMGATCEGYISRILAGDRNAARTLYFLLSPIFFYVHSLYQLQRQAWRTSVTACGIFCERIVRNLLLALDARVKVGIYQEFENNTFENRNGRVKKELEELRFPGADELFSLLKMVYSTRSTTGPHDVPPPEPDQARMNIGFCLPIYIRYIQGLSHLKEEVSRESVDFVSFISKSARVEVALAFGSESENRPVKFIVKERLYRLNFFSQDRTLKDVGKKLIDLRYSSSDSVLANALRELSTGRNAILTRTKRGGIFQYRERQSPNEYYKTVV